MQLNVIRRTDRANGETFMNRVAVVLCVLAIVATGCASYRPIVDMQGVDSAKYNSDLVQCQQYAEQLNPASHAVAGAVIGALIGAAIGGAIGNSDLALDGARVGAISGGVSGAADGAESQVNIVRRCMSGRGYRVLH